MAKRGDIYDRSTGENRDPALHDIPFGSLIWDAARQVTTQEAAFFDMQAPKAPMLTLMWHVAADPGRTMTHYAERMSVDQASFGRHVTNLLDDGMLVKFTDPEDSRKRTLRLTPEGLELVTRQREIYREFELCIRKSMGAARYDRLVELLDVFLTSRSAMTIRPPAD